MSTFGVFSSFWSWNGLCVSLGTIMLRQIPAQDFVSLWMARIETPEEIHFKAPFE